MDGRSQLVELVPRGRMPYAAIALVGAIIVGLLEGLYVLMPILAPHTTDGRVAALDLDGEGSLAVWFSSFTLVAAAATCLLVYVLRAGESHGRRLWSWAAACWTVMSIDECSSLHEAFKEVMSHGTGTRIWHDGTLWWVLAYFGVLSITGLALLKNMRNCRPAQLALVATAAFYGTAVLCELSWIMAKDARGVMIEEGCEMLGNLCLLMSASLFARHTAAEILLPQRETIRIASRRAA